MLSNDQTILLSALLGRDVSKEVAALGSLLIAVGGALPLEDQIFLRDNWKELADFARSDTGKIAVQTLVQDWKESKGVK